MGHCHAIYGRRSNETIPSCVLPHGENIGAMTQQFFTAISARGPLVSESLPYQSLLDLFHSD